MDQKSTRSRRVLRTPPHRETWFVVTWLKKKWNGFRRAFKSMRPSVKHGLVAIIFGLAAALASIPWLVHVTAHGQILTIVSASTEILTFEVFDQELASLPLRGMKMIRVSEKGPPKLHCINGLFQPALKSRVTYSRVGYGPLVITVVPFDEHNGGEVVSGAYQTENGESTNLPGEVNFMLDQQCDTIAVKSDEDQVKRAGNLLPACGSLGGAVNSPLPIFGRVTLGTEFRSPRSVNELQPFLLNGTLKVSAISINPLPFLRMAIFPQALYKAGDIDLPPASRLRAYSDNADQINREQKVHPDDPIAGQNEERADTTNWWGVCYCDPQKPALTVEMATDAPRLELHRPGTPVDIIEVTATTRVFEDPNLEKIYRIVGIFAIAVAIIDWLVKRFLAGASNA
jgi:hypothetical protein